MLAQRRLLTPSFTVALAALVVALGRSTSSAARARIFVESTRLLPFGDNEITPFLTNVSFDAAAIC